MLQLMVEQKYAWTHQRDERPHVSLKKNWMPTMTWKDDALILHAVREGVLLNFTKAKALTTFAIHLAVAEKFGFIEQPQAVTGYKLGPNLQFTLPTVAYDNQTQPVGPSFRRDMNWIKEHFAGMQPTDVNREVTDQVFQVKNNQLDLSRMVEWQCNNLNDSFEKLVGTSKRTVMVYTGMVESTVVGSGKFHLLREVQLLKPARVKVRWNPGIINVLKCEVITQWTPGYLTPWQNHGDHWPQTAIKTTTHPWVENTPT